MVVLSGLAMMVGSLPALALSTSNAVAASNTHFLTLFDERRPLLSFVAAFLQDVSTPQFACDIPSDFRRGFRPGGLGSCDIDGGGERNDSAVEKGLGGNENDM